MNFLTIQFTNLVDGHLSHEHKTIMGILASPTPKLLHPGQ